MTLFEKPFQIEGVIESNLATLKISQANYNPNTKELTSNYFLLVPKASKLLFLSKHKLHGKLQIAGTFKTKNSQFYLTGNSKSLGGEIIFNFEKNKLNTHMNKVEISRLLYFLGIKHYVKGKLTAEIKLSDLKEPKGIFNLSTEDASSINRTFKNELDLNFKKGIYFSLTAKGNINPKSINMESKLDSDIFQYSSSDIIYDIASKKLNSSYLLKLPKLSRLTPITGKELRGKVSIKGIANHQNQLLITGTSKSLGGNIDFVLQAKKINAKLNSVSVEKLMRMLSYPELFKARLQGDFVYDLSASIGTFRSTLNQAELLNSYLIEVLKKIQDVDLSKERYNKTYFNANFNKSIIDIDFKAQSSTVLLYIPSGRINKLSNSINANYQVKVGKKNLEGTIKGNISKPKVTIDSSKFIQNQMMNVIPLHLDKNTLKEFRIPKEESKMMKSMMNGFFR